MGMEMVNGGMTPAEAILLGDRRSNDDGFFGGNGSWVFFLFFLLAWGNGGWGGFGGGNRGMVGEAVATNADLQRGFDTQSITGKLDGLNNGLCDGFYAMNTSMLNGFNGIQRDLCSGFNGSTRTSTSLGLMLSSAAAKPTATSMLSVMRHPETPATSSMQSRRMVLLPVL